MDIKTVKYAPPCTRVKSELVAYAWIKRIYPEIVIQKRENPDFITFNKNGDFVNWYEVKKVRKIRDNFVFGTSFNQLKFLESNNPRIIIVWNNKVKEVCNWNIIKYKYSFYIDKNTGIINYQTFLNLYV